MRRTLTRRRLLVAGGAAAVLAAGATRATVGRRGRGDPGVVVVPEPPAVATAAPSSGQPSPTVAPPRGGTLRLPAAAALTFDTFDALRSGEPSVVEVLGRTHSRLLQWSDFDRRELAGDIAVSWEQPDERTLVLTLDERARWHDRPPLGGRPLAASDVVAHLQRALALARDVPLPTGQRAPDMARIARVTSPGFNRVVVETSAPDPLLPATLAGRFALLQAPEAVDAFAQRWDDLDVATVAGSGPFVLESVSAAGLGFAAFRAGHREPLVDRLQVLPPPAGRESFEAAGIDEFLARDPRDAAALRAFGTYPEEQRFEDFAVISTVHVGSPPWNNPGLRRALDAALYRPELARRLFRGAAAPALPVPAGFGATRTELTALANYYSDFTVAAQAARALWSAAGGPALGQVTVDFPSIFDPRYSASSIVIGQLSEVLGPQFGAAVEPYTTISRKAVEGRYGGGKAATWFGWSPPFSSPDPTRSLYEQYHSTSPGATAAGFRDSLVDSALDALASEFDAASRRDLTWKVVRRLLEAGNGGTFDWLVQFAPVFRQDYVKGRRASGYWPQHLDAAASVDTAAALYRSQNR